MLMKIKNIHKNQKKKKKFKIQKSLVPSLGVSPTGRNNQNLKEYRAFDSEIIATWTDEWMDNRRRTKVPYHDLCWQSQAELKNGP